MVELKIILEIYVASISRHFITFWIQVYLNFQHPSDTIHMALPTQHTHFPAHITTIISIICANVGFTCFW